MIDVCMVIRFSKNKFANTVALLVILLPTLAASLYSIVVPSSRIYIIFSILALLIFTCLTGNVRKISLDASTVFLLFMVCIVTYGYFKNGIFYGEYWIYILTLIFCLFAKNYDDWHRPFLIICMISELFFACATILMRMSSSLYYDVLPQLYPDVTLFNYWYQEGYMTGLTDHYSTNGMILAPAIIISFAVYIVVTKEGKNKKILPLFLVSIDLIALFLTGKRAHILFAAVGLLVAYYLYTRKESNHFIKYAFLLIVGLCAIYVSYYFIPQVANVLDRFANMGEDQNILLRFGYWAGALKSFNQHPFFGIGWYGFKAKVAETVGYTGNAHNVYIQILCENGIIGGLIIYSWMIYALICSLKNLGWIIRNDSEVGTTEKIMSFVSVAYLIFFALYSVTGNPLYDMYTYQLYFIFSTYSASKRQHGYSRIDNSSKEIL